MEFFGAATATSLGCVDLDVKERVSESFQDFYATSSNTSTIGWLALPTNISWIMLKEKNIDYTEVVELAKQAAPGIAEKDELFNEVVEVNWMLRQIPDEVFDVDPAKAMWQKISRATMRFHIYIVSSVPPYPSSWPMLSWSGSFLCVKPTYKSASTTISTVPTYTICS